jgi:hypothetical protein
MVINNCKHNGGFVLTYDADIQHYAWGCVRCMVYKLPFNPEIFPDGVVYTRDPPEGKKILPKIDYKAGEL